MKPSARTAHAERRVIDPPLPAVRAFSSSAWRASPSQAPWRRPSPRRQASRGRVGTLTRRRRFGIAGRNVAAQAIELRAEHFIDARRELVKTTAARTVDAVLDRQRRRRILVLDPEIEDARQRPFLQRTERGLEAQQLARHRHDDAAVLDAAVFPLFAEAAAGFGFDAEIGGLAGPGVIAAPPALHLRHVGVGLHRGGRDGAGEHDEESVRRRLLHFRVRRHGAIVAASNANATAIRFMGGLRESSTCFEKAARKKFAARALRRRLRRRRRSPSLRRCRVRTRDPRPGYRPRESTADRRACDRSAGNPGAWPRSAHRSSR